MRIFSLWKLAVVAAIVIALSYPAFAEKQIPQDLGRCSQTFETSCYVAPTSLPVSVAEPGMLWLLWFGLAGVSIAARRRR